MLTLGSADPHESHWGPSPPVPKPHCDLYSISFWKTWAPGKEDRLCGRLKDSASKTPHDGIFGEHNFMLGAFGAREHVFQKIQKHYAIYKGDTAGTGLYALHCMVDAAPRAGVS